MKVKVAGEHIITLTEAMSEYSPTPDAQETDITCVADVNKSLVGKYFKLYGANNANKYYVYYDVDTAAEVANYTAIANVSRGLSGKYFKFYDVYGSMYVPWFNTGTKEKNTLTCGAAAATHMVGAKEKNTLTCGTAVQTDMTGAKEKNTLTCGTAAQTDMTGAKEKNTLRCGTAAQTDMTGAKEKNTITCGTAAVTDMTGAKEKSTFTCDGAALTDMTGEKEKNTLTCSAASDTDMTGTKEVNTVVAEADTGGSLNSTCFHFWALDGNNGTDTEYYVWYNVSGMGVDPAESGTGIEVAIAMNDLNSAVATTTRSAITSSSADVTMSGAGANIVLTGDYWGESTAASDGTAGTGWSSFTRTETGVDITAGDYLTFYSGLAGSEVEYYVWFNATGGAAASTAPSLDPGLSVVGLAGYTGIEVEHAHDADANAMGTALRLALATAAPVGIVTTGATTDAIIENVEYGEGVIATTGSAPTNFSIARTNTGVDITAGDYITFAAGITGADVDYYAWFNATGGIVDNAAPSLDPGLSVGGLAGYTGIQVDHDFAANANEMATALKDALDAESISDITVTGAGGASADVTIENVEWGLATVATIGSLAATGLFAVLQDQAGVATTDGDYVTFAAGLSGSETIYYAWFNATGGAAVGEAPSTDPAPDPSYVGIQVDHAYTATANDMADELYAAIVAEGITGITVTDPASVSADVAIENDAWGIGVAATAGSLVGIGAFAVSRDQAGVDITAGEYFIFYVGNVLPTKYYAWFNATGGALNGEAPSTEPVVVNATGIEVSHAFDATNNEMATALKAALDAESISGITVSGAGGASNDVAIENTTWGLGTPATEHFTDVNFVTIRDQAGAEITAGEYFTLYSGLSGSEVKYYVWFNATGGGLSGEAPSYDPAPATGIGIEVQHSYAASADQLASAVRSELTTAAISGITVSGATNEVIIENDDWGIGVPMTDNIVNAAFAVARTVTGIDMTTGEYFTFYSGLTGAETEYYTWFNATGGSASGQAPSTDPAVVGATGIQVDHAHDADANAMGLALRTALTTAAPTGVTIAGATTDAIIENTSWGIGVAATDSITNVAFGVARTVTGVDLADGEYFIFYSGLGAAAVKYYAWLNATGGAAAGTAPSLEPTVADATGIEVEHAHDADANAMGTALRLALTTAAPPGVTITGATTNAIIENTVNGVGVAATEHITDGSFTVARTVTGFANSTQPVVSDNANYVEVDLNEDDTDAEVAGFCRTALNATPVTTQFTISGSTTAVILTSKVAGVAKDASAGNSGFSVSVTTQGVTDAETNDPNVQNYTGAKVTILPNETANNVAEKTKDILHALAAFGATRSNAVISVVNASNGECSSAVDGSLKTGFTFNVTTSGVTGIVAPTGQKLFQIVGTQPDTTRYGGEVISGRTKSVSLVALQSEIEYVEEGF